MVIVWQEFFYQKNNPGAFMHRPILWLFGPFASIFVIGLTLTHVELDNLNAVMATGSLACLYTTLYFSR